MIDEDTHREIVEIKKELRDVRQAQDASIHLERDKWVNLLDSVISGNKDMARLLLLIDGVRTTGDLNKLSGMHRMTCWRWLDKMEASGIIMKLDKIDGGKTVYKVSKWYRILRLDDYLRNKFSIYEERTQASEASIEQQGVGNNVNSGADTNQNQNT